MKNNLKNKKEYTIFRCQICQKWEVKRIYWKDYE